MDEVLIKRHRNARVEVASDAGDDLHGIRIFRYSGKPSIRQRHYLQIWDVHRRRYTMISLTQADLVSLRDQITETIRRDSQKV